MDIKQQFRQLKTKEKIQLLSGKNSWETQGFERIELKSVKMADGPFGLRVKKKDAVSINDSHPATTLPSPVLLACSFDRELLYRAGELLGNECRDQGVSLVLAPGVNIKRSPLCGRNFEYYSEDPHLSSHLAAAFIRGIQSRGVGACIKHFAVNNQEKNRMSVDIKVSKRTLFELYLKSFEYAVKSAKPWAVMCAYNSVNGSFCSQNSFLLDEVLRKRWGYEGLTISDWGAVYDRVKAVNAGLDLEMPSSNGYFDKAVRRAILFGRLSRKKFNNSVKNVLKLAKKAQEGLENEYTCNYEQHYLEVRRMAADSIVLLKNDNDILPFQANEKIAIIGQFAKEPRFQGNGSSHTNPKKSDNFVEELTLLMSEENVTYAQGYSIVNEDSISELEDKAVKLALNSQKVVYFMGLPDYMESESIDRKDMKLPENQLSLLQKLTSANKNIVLVLVNGSPVELSGLSECKGLVESYLGGEASGGAGADVLFGIVNPSGRLAETFPEYVENNPSYGNFGGEGKELRYNEEFLVGYRHYDTRKIPVSFPFGFGLSYTTFEYKDLKVEDNFTSKGEVHVSFTVTNSGRYLGKEVIQLYVKDKAASHLVAGKELKAFSKIQLKPKESQIVSLVLKREDFSYFEESKDSFSVESGEFQILVGKNSREFHLSAAVHLIGDEKISAPFTRESTVGEVMEDKDGKWFFDTIVKGFEGQDFDVNIASDADNIDRQFFLNTPLKLLPPSSKGAMSAFILNFIIKAINKKGWRLKLLKKMVGKRISKNTPKSDKQE